MRPFTFLMAAAAVAPNVSPFAQPKMPDNVQAMMQAYETAQAAAVRPGDEGLDCDALEEQLVAAVNDEAVQSYIASSGAAAQGDSAALESGREGEAARRHAMAAQAIAAFAGALAPGAGMAALTPSIAQAQAGQAQAAQRMAQAMQQTQQLMAIMPQLLRGQRLIDLAVAKRCEWVAAAQTESSQSDLQR